MLKKMSVAARIGAGFAVLIVLLLAVGLIGVFGVSRLEREVKLLLDRDLVYHAALIEARYHVGNLRRFEKDTFLNFSDAKKVDEYQQKWHQSLAGAQHALEAGEPLRPDTDGKDFDALKQGLKAYADGYEATLPDVKAGKYTTSGDINKAFSKYKDAVHTLDDSLGAMADRSIKHVSQLNTTVATIGNQTEMSTIALLVVAIVIGIGFATVIIVGVRRPLSGMQQAVEEIARTGQLGLRMPVTRDDEIGATSSAVNNLLHGMSEVIGDANRNASDLLRAAETLSEAAMQVTGASQTQSEASSATAASVEQMTVSAAMISDNAKTLEDEARQTSQTASHGVNEAQRTAREIQQVSDTIARSAATIVQLNQRSDEIGSIVLVIKEIADQTNLLALNAAIEAARAGELGRGFAVVADEVRKLAERTSQATAEITAKISAVQHDTGTAATNMEQASKMVETGVASTHDVVKALDEIDALTRNTLKNIGHMAVAMQEQSIASQDISRNLERIAQASEENHAAAASTSELSMQLKQLADSVQRSISRYR
ncbi:methyl-accepting chemotaxis protein [Andreprevotia chitinilytica]|uniref:methyl-accepting chemotaxis protein n=1 Tax=Andreprevotia chitinilytica TaxID=396808 RepID=UPI00068EEC7B|nr:methyl-accepting chemotaxis protein [Andreprevotia chitinilytica]